ncbi:hypothetical protein ACQY0O_006120 [Thecaphora frezii]
MTSTTATAFSFTPPPIHSFPPFYTLQPNPSSRSQQIAQWRDLILRFCRAHRVFSISTSPVPPPSTAAGGNEGGDVWSRLFRNDTISRSLNAEAVGEVLHNMVKRDEAAWESKERNRAWIYWKKPAVWGDEIYEWITKTGQNKSILTLFELTQGDLVQDQEFRDLPLPILRQALHHLAQQGKAQTFAGSDAEDGEGVKFL